MSTESTIVFTALNIICLVLAIILHEVAHGYAALRLGDPTARDQGRLTLNPLAHVDPMGTVILPLILILTQSPVLLGWAKPVPFNPGYFRNPRRGVMLVGAAGPVLNLLLAVVSALALRLLVSDYSSLYAQFFVHFMFINLMLGLFNLIPIPPLDGSRIVAGLLPGPWALKYLSIEKFGFIFLYILLLSGGLRFVNVIMDGVIRLLFSGLES